jgi:hypothetical protein
LGTVGVLLAWTVGAHSAFEVEAWPTKTAFINVFFGRGQLKIHVADARDWAGCRYPGSRIISGGEWNSAAQWGFVWPEISKESSDSAWSVCLTVPFWVLLSLYGMGVGGWYVWRSRRRLYLKDVP